MVQELSEAELERNELAKEVESQKKGRENKNDESE